MASKLTLLASLVLLVSSAYALEMHVPTTDITLKEGNSTVLNVEVINNEGQEVRALLTVEGAFGNIWVFPTTFSIPSYSSKEVKIGIFGDSPGNYLYKLVLSRWEDSTNQWVQVATKNFFVHVIAEKKPVQKEERVEKYLFVKADKARYLPGEKAILKIEVPKDALPGIGKIFVKKEGKVMFTIGFQQNTLSNEVVVPLPKQMPPGKYVIEASIEGWTANSTEIYVDVLKKLDITTSYEKKYFGEVTYVYAENLGNVPDVAKYAIKVPFYQRFVMSLSGNYTEMRSGKYYYISWIEEVSPGKKVLVARYSVDYTPYVAVALVILLGIITILYRKQGLVVKKEVISLGWHEDKGSIFKILITVKNTTDSPLENVVVEDKVPVIAKPIEYLIKEPTSVETTKEGTLLRWNIGRMMPGEEVIIAYKIALNFGVIGDLKLPDVKVRY